MTTPPNLESLFDAAETLSPRLQWMKKHGIEIHTGKFYDEFKDKTLPLRLTINGVFCGDGDDETSLLDGAAEFLGVKLWNEPGYQP